MEYDIRFCKTAEGRRIAFGTIGAGPPVLIAPGASSHLEIELTSGPSREIYLDLARHFTIIRYDRAGTGLSERNVDRHTPDSLRHEIEAVADAAGPPRFALVAMSASGPSVIEYALHNPERVSSLVFYCTWAGRPGNRTSEEMRRLREVNPRLAARELIERLLPSGGSREYIQQLTEFMVTAEGTAGQEMMDAVQYEDQRPRLEEIRVRTLVLHRVEDRVVPVGFGRQLAALIPNARFIPLPGGNHIAGSPDEATEVAEHIRDFLLQHERPAAAGSPPPGGFRTILFTDVVSSTPLLTQLKDEKMREVMREHDEVLQEAVVAHGGRVIKTIGDAFMADFGIPSAAVAAAIQAQRAIQKRFANSDIPVRIRIGINAGEPIEEAGDLHGASVVIAKRLEGEADPDGILVSDVVKQAVAGKDFGFEDRGTITLKGFDEPVRAWAVRYSGS